LHFLSALFIFVMAFFRRRTAVLCFIMRRRAPPDCFMAGPFGVETVAALAAFVDAAAAFAALARPAAAFARFLSTVAGAGGAGAGVDIGFY
jgi:hypothetical protein